MSSPSNVVPSSITFNSFLTGLSYPKDLVISGNILYVPNGDSGNEKISSYNASTGAVINASLVNGLSGPRSLAVSPDGTTLYVVFGEYRNTKIGSYNASTGAVINDSLVTGVSGLNFVASLALSPDGTTLYVSFADVATSGYYGKLGSYNASTGAAINDSLVTGLSYAYHLALSPDGTILYISNGDIKTIGSYNASTGAVINDSLVNGFNSLNSFALDVWDNIYVVTNDNISVYSSIGGNTPLATWNITVQNLEIKNNYLYVSNSSNNATIYISSTPITCFKEDSMILTDNGYIKVQDLKKGDRIKTMNGEYRALEILGTRNVFHPLSEPRVVDQLYKYSKEIHPELIEDLVITGFHARLVDEYKDDEQREKARELVHDDDKLDNKFKLPAYVDESSSVYEEKGFHNVYHVVLKNEDVKGKYGIYANGMLVESCSQFDMINYANMKMHE